MFLGNLSYQFTLPPGVSPDGSIITASSMPRIQLVRRKLDRPHLARRIFDPQLYLAGLDNVDSPQPCEKLASYPWFGVPGVPSFNSAQQTQKAWKQQLQETARVGWSRGAARTPQEIRRGAHDCVDFQIDLGVDTIILPSPLTSNPQDGIDQELEWLDAGIHYAKNVRDTTLPVFATVALSDVCLRRTAHTSENALLELLMDNISSREVDGVYIVLEQTSELPDRRHCSSRSPLESILRLVHIAHRDCGLRVYVNYLGQFGLACVAVGAEAWGSGWYKSQYRMRMADKMQQEGRARPTYWTHSGCIDIHLDSELDLLSRSGQFPEIVETTEASKLLWDALMTGQSVRDVLPWRYRMSNVATARQHYMESCIERTRHLDSLQGPTARLDHVQSWLDSADALSRRIANFLAKKQGERNVQTRIEHVRPWSEALRSYREAMGV